LIVARIVCFGDSLTSGHGIGAAAAFPAVLQERIRRAGLDFEVVNAGVSRATSGDALARLDAALRDDPRVLIIALGANDGLRGVPVVQVKANLSRMIEAAQARGVDVLLCGMEALPIYGWDYTMAFHNLFGELAAKYKVPLVPFILLDLLGNPRMMQHDRAHPNAEGARAIADKIWPYLHAMLQKASSRRSA
jgi:acyl-CoA thioesterase-1